MNNIFILEDNVKTLEFLCDLIKEKRTQEKVFCFSDIESGYAALKSTKIFNIFFLDISLESKLKDNCGYDFARLIREMPQYTDTPIIFITGYDYPIPEAINDIHCFRFLKKPISKDIFLAAYDAALTNRVLPSKITIRLDNGTLKTLKISDIFYITSEGHIQTYHTASGVIMGVRSSLENLQKSNPDTFIFSSRNTLINKEHVSYFDKYKNIVSVKDTALKVGNSYKPLIKEIFS
ncbi:MAG: response regulator transcription factor [Lachnospiraceae bacterium]|nr:response regulator transcription factor [Lachnospiraceae bacterium]